MLPEIVLLVLTLILVFRVLIPALIDALQYLSVAILYMSAVIAAFSITFLLFLVTYCRLQNDVSYSECMDINLSTLGHFSRSVLDRMSRAFKN